MTDKMKLISGSIVFVVSAGIGALLDKILGPPLSPEDVYGEKP